MLRNTSTRHTVAAHEPAQLRAAIAGEADRRNSVPLVAHIIFRLATGGLENGLVNLINRLPAERFRHAIICLKDYSEFRTRIEREDIEVYALDKSDGKQIGIYFRLWALLRRLRPQIVHTRNLGTLDCVVSAALAGVPHRIHGEHGWDMVDLHGTNRKYRLLRRATVPLVERYVTVSGHLADWLRDEVGVPGRKIEHICNGVDTDKFSPGPTRHPTGAPDFLTMPGTVVVGTVGRMEAVKDQLTLVHAFLHLLESIPDGRSRLRLVMVGDGILRGEVQALLDRADAASLAWLAGERADIAPILRCLDIFVLPSLNEGISNTILEAMATGLPIVATRVGGNPELVKDGAWGALVPAGDPAAMAKAIESYVREPALRRQHGRRAREYTEREHSLDAMVARYSELYGTLLYK